MSQDHEEWRSSSLTGPASALTIIPMIEWITGGGGDRHGGGCHQTGGRPLPFLPFHHHLFQEGQEIIVIESDEVIVIDDVEEEVITIDGEEEVIVKSYLVPSIQTINIQGEEQVKIVLEVKAPVPDMPACPICLDSCQVGTEVETFTSLHLLLVICSPLPPLAIWWSPLSTSPPPRPRP